MQNDESFFGEKHGKIAHGLNFAPKIILVHESGKTPEETTMVLWDCAPMSGLEDEEPN